MPALLAAGVSRAQIEDALAVCLGFNTTDRLGDAFAFTVPGPKAFEAGAKIPCPTWLPVTGRREDPSQTSRSILVIVWIRHATPVAVVGAPDRGLLRGQVPHIKNDE